jgi:serine phosphatase RsbU (regulator of sigma subunit)
MSKLHRPRTGPGGEAREQENEQNLLIQEALNAILRISLEPIPLDEQMQRVLSLILRLPWLALEGRGCIYLADEEAGLLVQKAQVGMPPGALSTCARVPVGTCLCGQAFEQNRIIFASCIDDRHTIRYPEIAPHGHYCVPISSGERPLGLLNLYVRDGHQPVPTEERFLCAVANVLAGVIERQRVEQELRRQEADRRTARTIQQGLLPKAMPQVAGFQIVGRLATADQVGGDCFDFIPLRAGDQEHLGVLVGDASGHGVAAALLMAETRAYLRALALTGADVGTLLTLSNRRLADDLVDGHFVTAILLRLDPHTRSLVHASAGHCPGYILDVHGRTKAVLPSTGYPLGIDAANDFPTGPATTLEPGELVLLLTDGVVEAASADGELFGLERTLAIVRAHQQEAPTAILDALFHTVGEFCRQQHRDDITAVVIKAEP